MDIIQQFFNHVIKSYENYQALKKNLVHMLCENFEGKNKKFHL